MIKYFMVSNSNLYKKFLDDFRRKENLPFEKKLEIFEEMYIWTRFISAEKNDSLLEGTKKNIRIAAILNKCSKNLSLD
ncbi:hypothetical protein JXA84_06780 [candidate division WOR-3 bacterium]|nr:hypothetical protein [candidate division WOR-3 bacterium]